METRYYSFLLRLWASETNGMTTWRFSLESSETGEKQIFANLGDLMEFLEKLAESSAVSRGNTEEKAS